ncbi:MAG TPA: hypothetical protein VHD81_05155 [Mycobacteriales bacterium]|nr:hypothetical protein [Mycobacteriales bacterium]
MNTIPARRRTPAASRLPWPSHEWCDVWLPMHLVAGSLTALDGDRDAVEELLDRIDHMNDDREVLTPAPVAIRRGDDATETAAAIDAALDQGSPVVCDGQPGAALAAGEPMPDLTLTLVMVPLDEVAEPTLTGSMRTGFRGTSKGESSGDHLLHLFGTWIDASLAGLPVAKPRR